MVPNSVDNRAGSGSVGIPATLRQYVDDHPPIDTPCWFAMPRVNIASVPQRSPFRFPGGKTWLIPWAREWLRFMGYQRPVEPFAGGASVSLATVIEGFVLTCPRFLYQELSESGHGIGVLQCNLSAGDARSAARSIGGGGAAVRLGGSLLPLEVHSGVGVGTPLPARAAWAAFAPRADAARRPSGRGRQAA